MRGVEIGDSGMQTTPWRGSPDPCFSSGTIGYRPPLLGFSDKFGDLGVLV